MRRYVALVFVAVMMAACGGKGGGSSSPTTAASSVSPGTPGTQPVDTKFTGEGSAEYWKLARSYQEASSKLGTNANPDLRQLFSDAARDIQAAVAVAPAEIKSDVTLVAQGFAALVTALNNANYDFTKLAPDLIIRFQSQDFVAASTRVGAYAKNVCGINVGG